MSSSELEMVLSVSRSLVSVGTLFASSCWSAGFSMVMSATSWTFPFRMSPTVSQEFRTRQG